MSVTCMERVFLLSIFLVYIPKQTIQSLRIDMELIVERNSTNFNLDNLEKNKINLKQV